MLLQPSLPGLDYLEQDETHASVLSFTAPPRASVLQSLDLILMGMVGAGLGIEALCLYFDLTRIQLCERLLALDLEMPADKPIRRFAGKNPWSVEDIRHLIRWWSDGIHVKSIAPSLARSENAIRAKARRIGLPRRDRRLLSYQDLPPLKPLPLDEPSSESLQSDILPETHSNLTLTPQTKRFGVEIWKKEHDDDALLLYFGQINNAMAAQYLNDKWGTHYSAAAVSSRWTRLGCKGRNRKAMAASFDPVTAEANFKASGFVKRQCHTLKRVFVERRGVYSYNCPEAQKRVEKITIRKPRETVDHYRRGSVSLPVLKFLERNSSL
ncbi:hypothetical protein [Beijerinckia indica]|uniref:Uncharacterized protein n=1 Tax=Beijerinckia indica subsp. indica (strain ATCC 9039 / DSM 1715 / NCIMB 8712) TaxID=395963 RepID=B2ILJ0_BEII9|nr:hypothetical protein [Beijerinckia indica]ACB97390.1 hypothetical protein Bind_3861 [Beijerinckia indica subsp. indica ATCC 9039]